jgi:hypothetical protein
MLRSLFHKNRVRIFNIAVLVFLLTPFAISCSQQKDKQADISTEEAGKFTIKYDLLGEPGGKLVVYSQDEGGCIMEVGEKQTIISVMEDGEFYVIAVDTTTNKGTKMLNPIYKSLIESVGAKTPQEFNMAIFEKMGGKVSGEKTIAGSTCEIWDLPDGMQKTCMTKDGLLLETESNIEGIKRGRIATEIIRGSTEGVDACSPGDAEIEFVDVGQFFHQEEGDAQILDPGGNESSETPGQNKTEATAGPEQGTGEPEQGKE